MLYFIQGTYLAIDQTDEVIVSHPSVEKETTSTDEYTFELSVKRSQWKMFFSATLSHLTLSLANHGIN